MFGSRMAIAVACMILWPALPVIVNLLVVLLFGCIADPADGVRAVVAACQRGGDWAAAVHQRTNFTAALSRSLLLPIGAGAGFITLYVLPLYPRAVVIGANILGIIAAIVILPALLA